MEDAPPAADDGRPTDWFGYPIGPPRQPVRCPHCEAGFTDRESYATHLVAEHGTRAPRRPRRSPEPFQRPALGRNPRSALQRRLHTVPLVLVITANVALVVAVLGALGAVDPPWWAALREESWGWFVVLPMLWPTVLFLAVRGLDD